MWPNFCHIMFVLVSAKKKVSQIFKIIFHTVEMKISKNEGNKIPTTCHIAFLHYRFYIILNILWITVIIIIIIFIVINILITISIIIAFITTHASSNIIIYLFIFFIIIFTMRITVIIITVNFTVTVKPVLTTTFLKRLPVLNNHVVVLS